MLLDTTFLIDFLRGERRAIELMRKMEGIPLSITEINVFELLVGVYGIKRDAQKHLEKIDALLNVVHILPLDRESTFKAAQIAGYLLKNGGRIEQTDCLIAGIGLAHGKKQIITRNKSHYERIHELRVVTY